MKTQEEIEQLALQRFPIEMVAIFTERDKVDKNKERRKIFIETYTQCQEDMAKEIEYWQGEFDHWHQQAMDMADKYNELLNKKE